MYVHLDGTQGESSTPWTSPDGVKFVASECPIQGFKKASETNTEGGAALPTPKAKVASSWRTNLKHRLKYGAAADFAATDEDMETVKKYNLWHISLYIFISYAFILIIHIFQCLFV